MKITRVKLKEEFDGFQPFVQDELGDIVILTGGNGSGKTRLLNMICQYIQKLENKDKLEIFYVDQNGIEKTYCEAGVLNIANYSHYDAVLQSVKNFSPYVIGKAKNLLKECNYEETALNALLVIHDMAYGYSEEYRDGKVFREFQEFASKHFDIEVGKTEKAINLFERDVDQANLSPGQLYLLRIAIACFFNKNKDDLLIILDEPELHLHPDAMIKMFEQLKIHFKDAQFWISTHSIELISYVVSTIEKSTVLCLERGKISLLRSDSGRVIDSLLGHADNSVYLQQFYNLPDQYACIRFALECFYKPEAKIGKRGDPQQQMIIEQLGPESIVVDYGAGKGRFLEQLAMDAPELINKIQYYVYNLPDDEDSTICKNVMEKNGISEEHYFDDIEKLKKELQSKVSHIFLVNVLHEIPPQEWGKIFLNISELLAEHGSMCIIERETLAVGEAPYDCCFLMITKNAVEILFKECEIKRHLTNKHIVGYVIKKKDMKNVSDQTVKKAVEQIKQDSIKEIEGLKADGIVLDLKSRYDKGISLAFWLNQYANASLIIENKFKSLEEITNGEKN